MPNLDRRSLDTEFSRTTNSLNLLRLLLAATVIVSHAWPLGGYGDDPQLGDQNLGSWAVAGFFGISGFLITRSARETSSMTRFAVKRFLRIVPGFLAILIVTAALIAPASTVLTGSGYDFGAGIRYVSRNANLVFLHGDIEGTLTGVPLKQRWNGALWTIAYEILCYVAIAVLTAVVPSRLQARTIAALFLLGTAATTAHVVLDLASDGQMAIRAVRLMTFFLAGALLHVYRRHVPVGAYPVGVAAIVLLASVPLGAFQIVGGLPVAYLLVVTSTRLPQPRFLSQSDFSYGCYIYGWPVEQLVATAFLDVVVPIGVYLAVVVALVIPCALASWFLVERPSLALATRLGGRVSSARHQAET